MKERRKNRGPVIAWVVLSLFMSVYLFLSACSSIDCPVQNTVMTKYNLKKADGTTDTLGVDTMWVWTPRIDGSDTLLINRLCGSTATDFKIPISHTQFEDIICTMVVDTIGSIWLDTIRIQKEDYPHFESVDCHPTYFHKITNISSTHDIIDTVVINKTDVNYESETEHFHLYLKARR